MLMRTLLTLGSIKTLSFSFLETVKGFKRTSRELAASISGTLCRSDVCEAKSERERAAVREERTHCRYGLRDCDYGNLSEGRKKAKSTLTILYYGTESGS